MGKGYSVLQKRKTGNCALGSCMKLNFKFGSMQKNNVIKITRNKRGTMMYQSNNLPLRILEKIFGMNYQKIVKNSVLQ